MSQNNSTEVVQVPIATYELTDADISKILTGVPLSAITISGLESDTNYI
jgi:hypothetical protein